MARFDYDVVIVGSGFGVSVAALRAAEKGYRGVRAGRRSGELRLDATKEEVIPAYPYEETR